jgi:hypothetical protein
MTSRTGPSSWAGPRAPARLRSLDAMRPRSWSGNRSTTWHALRQRSLHLRRRALIHAQLLKLVAQAKDRIAVGRWRKILAWLRQQCQYAHTHGDRSTAITIRSWVQDAVRLLMLSFLYVNRYYEPVQEFGASLFASAYQSESILFFSHETIFFSHNKSAHKSTAGPQPHNKSCRTEP